MENPTGFDLKQATGQWMSTFEHLSLSASDIAELEVHLQDSMAALEGKGLSAEESFLVAKQRIGSAEKLDREFRKVRPDLLWLKRGCWIVFGALLAPVVTALTTVCVHLVALFFNALGFEWGVIKGIGLVVQFVVFSGLFAIAIRIAGRTKKPFWGASRTTWYVTIPGALGVLAIIHLSAYFARVLTFRFVPISATSELILWSAYGSLIFWAILPFALAFMVKRVAAVR
ncbi:MAG TPA: hypothetical protein VM735_09635 [Candidatus Kapabacteria bacterium]|nr:hypothetical protein [Candidatus Kapabacteria bacterium]